MNEFTASFGSEVDQKLVSEVDGLKSLFEANLGSLESQLKEELVSKAKLDEVLTTVTGEGGVLEKTKADFKSLVESSIEVSKGEMES